MAAAPIEIRGIEALGARLRALGDDAPNAVLRAIKRTRTTVMTRLARWVSGASGLPVRRVQRSIHGSQPNRSDPNVTITLWGGRDALIRYNAGIQRGAMPARAFRAKMPQGHVGFFERRPGQASLHAMPGRAVSKRIRPGVWHTLPIDEVGGPPFTSFITGVGLADLLQYGGDVFVKNLEAEITFREGRNAA